MTQKKDIYRTLERRLEKLLDTVGVLRPASSALPFLGCMIAAMDAIQRPKRTPIAIDPVLVFTALFHDWGYWREDPIPSWSLPELGKAQKIIAEMLFLNPKTEPLPPFPAPPTKNLKPAELQLALWRHMDHLGLRCFVLLHVLELYKRLEPGPNPVGLLWEANDLADQIAISCLPGPKEHAVDLDMLSDGMMTRLAKAHQALDELVARAPKTKQTILRRLDLNAPVYPVAKPLFDLDEMARGATDTLPHDLVEALADGLKQRKCWRPLGTLIPLAQRYVRWKAILHDDWTWVPEIDGRELAVLIFETTPANTPPWTLAQARRFITLTNQLHHCASDHWDPLPSPGEQDLSDDSGAVLWLHMDAMSLVYSLGLGDTSLLSDNSELNEMLSDGLISLLVMTDRWHRTPAIERGLLRESAGKVLGLFSSMLRPAFAHIGKPAQDLIPDLPFPEMPRAWHSIRKVQRLHR